MAALRIAQPRDLARIVCYVGRPVYTISLGEVLMGKRIDPKTAPSQTGCGYPSPFDLPCAARARQRLGDAAGLTDFGVNLLRLPPGVWSSQRHWHMAEDEFVFVIEGEVVLVTDSGEEVLGVGDCAGFKAGIKDGHHLQNRSSQVAVVLEVGSRKPSEDQGEYPDIDLRFLKDDAGYAHKDGSPYAKRQKWSNP
jgi:uncharacterized cupin superfamily protein